MQDQPTRAVRVPPRWFVRLAWSTHRALYRLSGGRFGLRRPGGHRWGMMRLTTIGRRSGHLRSVMLGYITDGPNLVTLAMNGWADADPAWWLNLQAVPEATVDVSGDHLPVRGRRAVGPERDRLWERWRQVDPDLDGYAALRSRETAVVILEPTASPADPMP